MAAITAGVRSIEHGPNWAGRGANAWGRTGPTWFRTRPTAGTFRPNSAPVPDYAAAKLTALAARHADAVALAIERGVTIAMGTDIAITGPDRPNAWGSNGDEVMHLVKLGMTPLQAIEAATATAPLTLGPQAPRSGQLEAGYDADVITVGADPLADISVLARPEHITAVWTAGRRVKG